MSILVVGSVALDSIKTPFGRVREILGGSATYFSVCASFFTDVNVVAVVGRDFPKDYLGIFTRCDINIDGLEIANGRTFRWKGFYTYELDKAHTLSTHLNVFATFQPKIPVSYKRIKDVFLANIDPDIQYNVLKQVGNARFKACDSMNYWIEKKHNSLVRLFKKIDLVFLNESEAREFSNKTNLRDAASYIISKGPVFVIIKRAEAGAMLFARNFMYCAPAHLCPNVIDPTGAGDSFAGGFMGYISGCNKINKSNLCKALSCGTVMASYAIEDFSIRRLLKLKGRDIKRRLAEYKKMVSL